MKKNIAIIIPSLNRGGAERCASNLSIELSKVYNVFLFVFDGRDMTYPYGGTLVDLRIPGANSRVLRTFNILKRIKFLKLYKRKFNIDCSISLLHGANMVNVLSRKKDKVIVSIRNCLSKERVGRITKLVNRYVSKKADLTVCLSKYVEYDMVNNFDSPCDRTITIYNHCDPELLRKLGESNAPKECVKTKAEEIVFVTMGRLSFQKGQWHLIRSFKRVLQEQPLAKLLILGEGELEGDLKKLVRELGIDKNVSFMGYVKNPHAIIGQCDIFVFPSLFEGLGNVLLEALAMGLPIISSDCLAGPREILAPDSSLETVLQCRSIEEFGVLVPICDDAHFNSTEPLTDEEMELSKAMVEMSNNQALIEQFRKKSKDRILDFSKEKIIGEWKNAIDSLIE